MADNYTIEDIRGVLGPKLTDYLFNALEHDESRVITWATSPVYTLEETPYELCEKARLEGHEITNIEQMLAQIILSNLEHGNFV